MSDVSALRASVEAALASVVPRRAPADLYDPYRYVMAGEGKRLRPVLLLLAAEACGVPAVEAMPAALATEVFHNFTLVHDDIMDRASTRRGRDTVHVRWDEPTAILAGDLMMGESYGLLAQTRAGDLRVLLEAWGEMVRRLCEGQMEDMRFATDLNVSVERYLRMIDGKTGALVAFCFEAGAILAGADADTRRHLHDAGIETGRAFQILDDLLDLTADDAAWGKTVGGDLVEGKRAYLLLRALETTTGDDRAFFQAIADRPGLDPDAIPDARARMETVGVLDDARGAVARHTAAALACLAALPPSDARDGLAALVRDMAGRGR